MSVVAGAGHYLFLNAWNIYNSGAVWNFAVTACAEICWILLWLNLAEFDFQVLDTSTVATVEDNLQNMKETYDRLESFLMTNPKAKFARMKFDEANLKKGDLLKMALYDNTLVLKRSVLHATSATNCYPAMTKIQELCDNSTEYWVKMFSLKDSAGQKIVETHIQEQWNRLARKPALFLQCPLFAMKLALPENLFFCSCGRSHSLWNRGRMACRPHTSLS